VNKLCVYGATTGWTSFDVVTKGFVEGARECGRLGGLIDASVSQDSQGLDAEVAVMCGDYRPAAIFSNCAHKHTSVMLAANSSWVPEAFFATVACCSEILTPSEWSATQIRNAAPEGYKVPVRVVPHGILRGFQSSPPENRTEDRFCIGHLAASHLERKNTWKLVQAFMGWVHREDCLLAISVPTPMVNMMHKYFRSWYGDPAKHNVSISPRFGGSPLLMRDIYSAVDAICQPSSAEGFGLVPLEALACGTPVAIPVSTGHAQWCHSQDGQLMPGIVPIAHGPDEPIPYEPGRAPSVTVEDITHGLDEIFHSWDKYKKQAQDNAVFVSEAFRWSDRVEEWMKTTE